MRRWPLSSLVWIKGLSHELLAKPTLTYCQLGMCEQPSLKIVLQYNNLHLRKCIWKSRTSTILFWPQYVNILRIVTQPFRRWVWSATWRHETGEKWVMWWLGSWGQQPTVWFHIDPMCIDHYHHWLFIHLFIYQYPSRSYIDPMCTY